MMPTHLRIMEQLSPSWPAAMPLVAMYAGTLVIFIDREGSLASPIHILEKEYCTVCFRSNVFILFYSEGGLLLVHAPGLDETVLYSSTVRVLVTVI